MGVPQLYRSLGRKPIRPLLVPSKSFYTNKTCAQTAWYHLVSFLVNRKLCLVDKAQLLFDNREDLIATVFLTTYKIAPVDFRVTRIQNGFEFTATS